MIFNNTEAKRGYKNLVKNMTKEEKRGIVELLNEMAKVVDEKMDTIKREDAVMLSASVEFDGLIYPLVVIGFRCETCDTRHIEILEVRNPVFSLN